MNDNKTNHTMFISRLYEQLNKHNMSQRNLAAKIGISQSTISNYSDESLPNSSTLCKIADAFGVTTDYLLGRTPYETPEIAAHSLATELNLSSDALSGLINNLKDFQDMAGIVSHKDAERYMNEFLKSPVLTLLMFSGLLICCKNDQILILNSALSLSPNNRPFVLDMTERYLLNLVQGKCKDFPIDPQVIIDMFCNDFGSFIPADEVERLQKVTSPTETASILRHSKSTFVQQFYNNYLNFFQKLAPEENAKFIKEHGSDIIDALSGFSDINASENSKESDSPNIDIEKLKELLK